MNQPLSFKSKPGPPDRRAPGRITAKLAKINEV